jgi:hypothetical protein
VALATAASFHHVGIGCSVLKREWSGLFWVTVVASTKLIPPHRLIGSLNKPVAIQTCDIALHDRMLGLASKGHLYILVTSETESRFMVEQQFRLASMHLVA